MNPITQLSDSEALEKLIQDQQSKKAISLKVRLGVLPYRLWLASLREVSLIVCLLDNYDKIPPKTPTKLIVGLFKRHSKLKNLLFSLEKRLRRRVL